MKTLLPLVILASSVSFASAASIAMNFSENSVNQGWLANDTPIGPLGILTGNFNSNNSPNANGPANVLTGNLATGTAGALVDSDGSAVATTIAWSSANPYYNSSGVGTDEARLGVGYLDDGGSGANITVTNISYTLYNVYVLLGSDAGNASGTHVSEVPLVNGTPVFGGDFPAYGNTGAAGGWVEADGTSPGNYVKVTGLSGSTLTIAGQNNTGNRIGISGFIVEQVPEPSAALLGLAGSLLLLKRRRA